MICNKASHNARAWLEIENMKFGRYVSRLEEVKPFATFIALPATMPSLLLGFRTTNEVIILNPQQSRAFQLAFDMKGRPDKRKIFECFTFVTVFSKILFVHTVS